jgi:hypothetical protein
VLGFTFGEVRTAPGGLKEHFLTVSQNDERMEADDGPVSYTEWAERGSILPASWSTYAVYVLHDVPPAAVNSRYDERSIGFTECGCRS